jgi:hypothetical protein
MNKEKELEFVTNLLNQNNINYWLDSGTLLGLYREGKVLEHDKDIDISVWDTEEEKIIQISKYLLKHYTLRVLNYGGYNFKYKFTPKGKSRVLKIDFNLFIQKKDYALCPQPIVKNNIILKIIWRLYNLRYQKLKKVKFDSPFFKLLFKMYTWKVPAKFFIDTTKKGNFVFPSETENYLEFRYGNWRIPQKNWSFINDDKGLSKLDINNF